jgi:hypothetical protein
MASIPVSKNSNSELPIPSVWRIGLKRLADASILAGTIEPDKHFSVAPFDPQTKEINAANIMAYPDALGPLAEKSWDTSVYLWQDGHWEVLVDLSGADGETTDLVFHAIVREDGDQFIVEPGLIYVP